MESASHDFLLDLDADPLEQAVQVHRPARARTLAGIEQEVLFSVGVLQAYFAGYLFLLVLILHMVVLKNCSVEV